MVLNRTHIPWFLFTLLASLALAAGYGARFHPEWLPFPFTLPAWLRDTGAPRQTVGGTRLGLLYGLAGFLIFLFAALLGARKKKPLWRIGRVETWLKAHIWLTILTIPLVGFHCGWTWGSPHTTWLLAFYIIVMVSGFFGLAMQQFMPGLMKERLSREVVYDQIPDLRQRILLAAQELRQDCTPPNPANPGQPVAGKISLAGLAQIPPEDSASAEAILAFLNEEAMPYLQARKGAGHWMANPREAEAAFRQLKLNVAPKWVARVEDVQGWCEERRLMDIQTTLQHWLHGWLLIHVPVSILLIVMTLWHAIVAVRLFVVQP